MNKRRFMQFLASTPLLGFAFPALCAARKRHIPETVDELYSAMCAAMPVGESTDIAFAVTGEPYVESGFCIANHAFGFSDEIESIDSVKSEAELCRLAWLSFLHNRMKLRSPLDGVLYWRIEPEIAFFDDEFPSPFDGVTMRPVKKARIYLRYLISSRSERYTQEQLLARNYPPKDDEIIDPLSRLVSSEEWNAGFDRLARNRFGVRS